MKHPDDSFSRKPSNALERWLSTIGTTPAFAALAGLGEHAVLVIDAKRRIVFWNHRAEDWFGFPAEQMVEGAGPAFEWTNECLGATMHFGQGAGAGESLEIARPGRASMKVRRHTRIFTHSDGSFAGAIVVLAPQAEETYRAGAPRSLPLVEEGTVTFHGLVSGDPKMHQAFAIIRNVAETDSTVLVRGESGSGKELVARAIHALSHRREGPFLAVNCAALTPSLLESELFGHVRGAFTGAVKDHPGLFQRADRGTVFLDEVAEMPLDLQAKLLRVLQDRTFIPVGGERAVRVDVRIVSATHRALREEVKAGRFREDLLYRLRVVPIFLPSLRERRSDIALLLWHFIAEHNVRGPRLIERIAPEAMRVLLDHRWPGNVRELRNVVEYAFAVGRGRELLLEELPPEFRAPAPFAPGETGLDDSASGGTRSRYRKTEISGAPDEAEQIRSALQAARGRIDEAARIAGMSRATFWRKRKLLGI